MKLHRILIFVSFLSLLACKTTPETQTWTSFNRANALWNIVSQQCVPDQIQHQNPAPCEEVTFTGVADKGYVVLKDKRGPLQYLLMPTHSIHGMESPEIVSENSPNFFYEAWKARMYMSKKLGAPIADENISLAINSQYGRSQNHMHIHISCIREDVRRYLISAYDKIKNKFQPLSSIDWTTEYYARRLSEDELKNKNVFALLAQEVSSASDHMNEFGLALVVVPVKIGKKTQNQFVLLADRANLSHGHRASIEDIQDHNCPLVIKK